MILDCSDELMLALTKCYPIVEARETRGNIISRVDGRLCRSSEVNKGVY